MKMKLIKIEKIFAATIFVTVPETTTEFTLMDDSQEY